MNIYSADVVAGGRDVKLVADGISLTVPAERLDKVASAGDQQVLVGIRPEYLSLNLNGQSSDGHMLRLPVELVETLGSEQLVHMRGPEGADLVARIESEVPVRSTEIAEMIVDMNRVHVFDRATGAALA